MDRSEALFFEMMKGYLPKENKSQDTVDTLKAIKLCLRVGDLRRVTAWSQQSWEIRSLWLASYKKELIPEKPKFLTARVVNDIATKAWPVGKIRPVI